MINAILAIAALATAAPPDPYAGWIARQIEDDHSKPLNVTIPPLFHEIMVQWSRLAGDWSWEWNYFSFSIEALSKWRHEPQHALAKVKRDPSFLDAGPCFIGESPTPYLKAFAIPKDPSEDCLQITWTGPGTRADVLPILRHMAVWYADHNHPKP